MAALGAIFATQPSAKICPTVRAVELLLSHPTKPLLCRVLVAHLTDHFLL
jgi:hypothetical protein